MMLAHNSRCTCWWYGSRGWTFPAIFCYILLSCDRWQQRGTLTERYLTWKHVWSKSVELNSSIQKKLAPIDIHCCLLNIFGDHAVDVSTMRQWWCLSAVVTVTVGYLCWCRLLWVQHAGSFSLWQKCTANGGGYVEKCSVAENFLYQTVLLCSLYLLLLLGPCPGTQQGHIGLHSHTPLGTATTWDMRGAADTAHGLLQCV